MIPTLLATQLMKKRQRAGRQNVAARKRDPNSSRRNSISTSNKNSQVPEPEVDKIELLKRYGSLLKTTVIAFILSTMIHISIVVGYYYMYLYLNPDDPGKKKFYATTTTSPGVKIGSRVIGRGGVQTNHHKSYLLHLVREHYKSMSKLFFLQFSIIYLILLALLKFFPERERLREDTMSAFHLSSDQAKPSPKKTTKSGKPTTVRKRLKSARVAEEKEEDMEFMTTDEDIEEEVDDDNTHEETIYKKDN